MINNSKTLFVKDGDDILIQRSNNQTDGFRTSVYKHFESNMHVVVCRTPSPIYTLNIYVPTASTDDKGLPHMLEHLVFCGSKHYPARGYLDVLAAHNFSTGTNAWTTNDNTCYTLDAASEDAVANVLPVFLDHILNPLLLDDHFVTEVYHYDEMGKEQGVVFSEMGSRENKESTLAHYHLKKLMYKPGTIYSTYSGGKTYEIANLTNKEIIDYHHKYYDANNITVVLTGAFSNDFEEKYLQTIPADIVQSHGCDSREPMDCSPPSGDGHPIHDVVKFPSADTSSGSFGFGWHGPDREDVEANIALEIMMEYLAGTPSSPLNLYFVACSTPLASSILTYPNSYIPRMLKLTFNGVPYLHTSHFSPKSRGKFNIGLHAKQFDIIADLGKRPVEFWLDLLKKWLIDQTMYYVAMVPDLELGSKIEAKRKAIEQANMAKIVDKKAHIGHIKRAIEASKVNVPKNMKEAIPVPDLSKTSILLHTQNLVVLDNNIGPVSAVQTINAESEFTSEASFSFKLDIPFCPTGKRSFDDELADLISLDYFALRMLADLMGRMDGPLDNAVRGKGYSYVYSIMQAQETPMKMLDQSISNSIHGFANADEYNTWCSTHIAAVKMSDMRRVFEKYVLRFADNNYPMFRIIVTPSVTTIPAKIGSYQRMSLEEISATYNLGY
ncbi:hypothetical protein IWW48_002881 [Coemansia sp. RSA 1200]|nr:hypothetical protein IWW48_002881 [Coemansia sp. RSA 1200]